MSEAIRIDLTDPNSVIQAIIYLQREVEELALALDGSKRMSVMLLGRVGGEAVFTQEQLTLAKSDDQHIDHSVDDEGSITLRLI